jgi:hypothetical protein
MNYEQLLAQYRAGGTLTLDQLRFLFGELITRAEAMPGTITAETPAADAERIEGEHTAALAELARVGGQVAEMERARHIAITQPASDEMRSAIAAERARIGTIQDDGRHFGLDDAFIQRHIADGTEATAFRLAILDDLRTNSERNPVFSQVEITRDEGETRRAGMTAAIVARLARAGGQRGGEVPAIAQPWAERDLVEIAADCIGWRGPLRTARQVDEMFHRAFLTTSDFPDIFTNALNVRLLARYQMAAPTYRLWAAQTTVPDFRASPVIRAGDFPALQLVNEAGEIKSGAFSESKETFQVYAYAVMLNITRQMMVNDQLNAIEQVLGSAGERVADWENVQAYASMLLNDVGPTLLTDSKAVFHADHGNFTTTGTAISVTSMGVARALMMRQTTLDGLKANFTPVTLLTSPEVMTVAEQLITAITPATNATAVPESLRRVAVVGDANITGTPWFLFASPQVAPTFQYGYLSGFEGPRLSSEDVFDVQGMRVKLEHDFGVGAIDYRGAYRNDGA